MKALPTHVALRLAMVVVMCASSIGFTTSLTYCTMSHSSECCCSDDPQSAAAGRSETASINSPNVDCNIQIVAGGAVPVALNVVADASVKTLTSNLIPMDSGVVPLPVVHRQRILAYANDMAPPAGDLYIRNCTLLM